MGLKYNRMSRMPTFFSADGVSGCLRAAVRWPHTWPLALLLVYLSPLWLFPEEARFVVFDNLIQIHWYKLLAESGQLLGPNEAVVPGILGGLPRGVYYSEFFLPVWIWYFLKPLHAHCFHLILLHAVAYLSAWLLLRRHVWPLLGPACSPAPLPWLALLFALTPFWPNGGLTIAAQPLLLYAFLNVYKGPPRLSDWLIVALFSFCSLLILGNLFFMLLLAPALLAAWLLEQRQRMKAQLPADWQKLGILTGAMALFTVVSILVEYRLFTMQFVENYQSIRLEFTNLYAGALNYKGYLTEALLTLLDHHHHFVTYGTLWLLPFGLWALIAARQPERWWLGGVAIVSILLPLPDLIYLWDALRAHPAVLEKANSFTLRFAAMLPLCWLLCTGLTVGILYRRAIFRQVFFVFIAFFVWQGFSKTEPNISRLGNPLWPVRKDPIYENVFFHTYFPMEGPQYRAYTFREYFNEALFIQIRERLFGQEWPPSAHVFCIGFDPSQAAFNRLTTADGLHVYYPLAYKKALKDVFAAELARLPGQADLFDGDFGRWGNLFPYMDYFEKADPPALAPLLNVEAMKKLGVGYILSVVPLLNAEELGLQELFVQENPDRRGAIRQLRVYAVR